MLFAREVLLFEPDEWQRKALMDLAENPKVAIKSGQGVGKTGMEAVALPVVSDLLPVSEDCCNSADKAAASRCSVV